MNAAYVAGFFDGEGYAGIVTRERGTFSMRIAFSQKTRAVLDRICQFLGFGRIHRSKRGHFHVHLTNRAEIRKFISIVYPHAVVKRRQLEVLRRYLELPAYSHNKEIRQKLQHEIRRLNK